MKRPWTGSEVAELRRLYPDMLTERVAEQLGRGLRSVRNKVHNLGLRKSPEFLASEQSSRIREGLTRDGKRSNFPKGNKPWNAGKKGVNGISATRFTPGNNPHTWKPVGTERLNRDGNLARKVSDTGDKNADWKTVHRLVWEAANGPTPKGSIVVFKRGMKTAVREEITLDRLECITRRECVVQNHPRNKSPELGKLSQLKGAIQRQVNRIVRESQEQTA